MSYDPFDDLPDQMKEAIREMMKKLQEIDPEQLEDMMRQVFGEEFLEKMRDIDFSGGSFGFPLNPEAMKNFEGMMRNFMDQGGQPTTEQEKVLVEEPYYELTPAVDGEGQLVVDLPGITDVRQVQWSREGQRLNLEAESEDAKYEIEIPVKKSIIFKDMFASLKNSVFILPFRIQNE